MTLEREPSEWHSWRRRLLAVWQGSRLSQSRRHTIQSFHVSLRRNGRESTCNKKYVKHVTVSDFANIGKFLVIKLKNKTKKRITFCLRYQNIGIDLPFFISNFISSSNWTDTIVSGIFVATKLQVTPTNLMKQPGLLQTTTYQGNLLRPAELQTYKEKKLK